MRTLFPRTLGVAPSRVPTFERVSNCSVRVSWFADRVFAVRCASSSSRGATSSNVVPGVLDVMTSYKCHADAYRDFRQRSSLLCYFVPSPISNSSSCVFVFLLQKQNVIL